MRRDVRRRSIPLCFKASKHLIKNIIVKYTEPVRCGRLAAAMACHTGGCHLYSGRASFAHVYMHHMLNSIVNSIVCVFNSKSAKLTQRKPTNGCIQLNSPRTLLHVCLLDIAASPASCGGATVCGIFEIGATTFTVCGILEFNRWKFIQDVRL